MKGERTNSAPSHAPVSARKRVKRSTGESPHGSRRTMKREPTDDATESQTLRRDGHSPHGNRETPEIPLPVGGRGRLGKVIDQALNAHVNGESDDLIVPGKQANRVGPTPAAESVEGRGAAKGNVAQQAAVRT